MGVGDLSNYRALYKSCLGLNSDEMAVLVGDLNGLVEDPTCNVNTTAITSSDATAGHLNFAAVEHCSDDDVGLGSAFGDEDLTCTSAAASGMCSIIEANGGTNFCGCSCPEDGSGPVCHNDDAGLAAAFGDPAFTCPSAAISGMCGLVEANAPGMCGCSCGAEVTKPGVEPYEVWRHHMVPPWSCQRRDNASNEIYFICF
eukprot:SAG22_NODE_3660_length_1587_cov_3.115591_2_plen_199_part_01